MHRHARNYTNYSLDEITSGLKRDLLILTVCIVYVLTKNDVDAFFSCFFGLSSTLLFISSSSFQIFCPKMPLVTRSFTRLISSTIRAVR